MRIQIDNLLADVTLMFMVDALSDSPTYCTCNSGAPVLAHFHFDAYSHGHSDTCCFLLVRYFRFFLLFCLIDARFVFHVVYLSFSSFSTSCSSSSALVFFLSILSLFALVDFVFILSLCFPNLDRFIPFFSLRSCFVFRAQQLARSFSSSYYCRLRVAAFCIPCGSMCSAAMCLWSAPVVALSGHSLLHMIMWSIFKIGSSMAASVSVAFHGCSWMFLMAKSLDLLCLASLKDKHFWLLSASLLVVCLLCKTNCMQCCLLKAMADLLCLLAMPLLSHPV